MSTKTETIEQVQAIELPFELYAITDAADIPKRERDEVWDKLEKLMKEMNAKQAFVCLKKDSWRVTKIAKREFPERKFKISIIKDNIEYTRIYRVI
jgi:hypothetical protein